MAVIEGLLQSAQHTDTEPTVKKKKPPLEAFFITVKWQLHFALHTKLCVYVKKSPPDVGSLSKIF